MAKPSLIYLPKIQCLDNSGIPLNGGQLFVYLPGTTTKLNTFTDATMTVVNPNPVSLDSAGRPSNSGAPIDLYVTQAYKMVAAPAGDTDPPMSPIWTEDNVTTLGQQLSVSNQTTNYTIQQSDRDSLITVDCSNSPVTITLLQSLVVGNGFVVAFKKTDSTTNTLTVQAYGSETIDGSNTLTTSTQYHYVQLENDGTQWLSNVNPLPAIPFTNQLVFSTSSTWTTPLGITLANVCVWGAGGGGGGSSSTTIDGGGGGGGAYVQGIVSVVPGTTTTVTVGTGGAGAALNTTSTGTAGSSSSFGGLVVAAGGAGGVGGATGAAGGAGGSPASCTVPTNGVVLAGGNGDTTVATFGILGKGGASPTIGLTPQGGVVGANGPPNTGAGGTGGNQTVAGGTGATGYVVIRY